MSRIAYRRKKKYRKVLMSIGKDLLFRFLTFLKDYGATLLIVPAVAGGVWQICKLGSLSLSLIRFFSITQVVPDGLLILMFIGIIILQYGMIFGLNALVVGIASIIEDKRWIRKIKIFIFKTNWDSWPGFFTILPLGILTILYMGYIFAIVGKTDIYLFIANQLTFLLSLFIILNFLYNTVSRKYPKFRDHLFIYWGMMAMIFAVNLFVKFGNIYSIPNTTINMDILNKKIKKDFPNSIPKLKYMNDKYLFFEIATVTKNDTIIKYKILEVQNLFVSAESQP